MYRTISTLSSRLNSPFLRILSILPYRPSSTSILFLRLRSAGTTFDLNSLRVASMSPTPRLCHRMLDYNFIRKIIKGCYQPYIIPRTYCPATSPPLSLHSYGRICLNRWPCPLRTRLNKSDCTFVIFPVGEEESAPSVLEVFLELSFVLGPKLIHFFQVLVVEWFVEDIGILIVESTSAGELVLRPMSLVGQFARLVEKLALTLHLVEPP